MSVTIDTLDIQIRSSAGSASANIDKLAKSLENLRSNAKLTTVSNNLTKLATALGQLQVNSTSLQSIRGLAGAMKSLAAIPKATGGFNSLVNTMKKLPGIVSALDPLTLERFAQAMKKLGEAVKPLATQMDKVSKGFEKLPNKVRDCVSAVKKLDQTVDHASATNHEHSSSLFYVFENYENLISVLQTVGQAFEKTVSQAIEWDGIQYRFGRAFGEDAEEMLTYVDKVNSELKISKQEFMQYSGLFGSLVKGFGMDQEQVTPIAIGLTELSYDIWAAHNDQYKRLEDAADAVKSAITGELEPIRNAGIAMSEASMQDYLDQIGKAHVSLEKLSEAQKAEVRYAVMVNGAMNQGIIGTYAKEMQTAEGAMRMLKQQTKSLAQAFGSLFIPVLQKIIPWVSAFVELIYEAIIALGALLGIEFQAIDWDTGATGGLGEVADSAQDATGALGDAADEAKKLKDYTMGFDELNIISPPKDTAAGGAGAGVPDIGGGSLGLDLETLWDKSVFEQAKHQVDELKQKIKDWFEEWKTQIIIIGAALAALGITNLLQHMADAVGFGEKLKGAFDLIKQVAGTAIIITIQFSLQKKLFGDFLDGEGIKSYLESLLVGGISSFLLYKQWGTGGLAIGLAVTAYAAFSAIWEDGGVQNAEGVVTLLTGIASSAGAIAIAWNILKATNWVGELGAFVELLKEGNPFVDVFAAAFPKLSGAISKAWGWFGKLGGAISGLVSSVGLGTLAGIVAAIAAAFIYLYRNWEDVVAVAKRFFDMNIAPILQEIAGHWDSIKEALSPLGELFGGIVTWIGNAVGKVGEFIEKVGLIQGIGLLFELVGGIIVNVLMGVVAGAFQAVMRTIEGFVQFVTGVAQIVGGIIDFVIAIFHLSNDEVNAALSGIWEGCKNVFGGLWDMIITPVSDLVTGIIDWFRYMWDELVGHSIIPDTVNAIVEWFTSLPGKLFTFLENFVKDVIKFFADLWKGITNALKDVAQWFREKFNEARKWVEEAFRNIGTWFSDRYTDVKEVFRNIGVWFGEKFSEAWDAVKEIFSPSKWIQLGEDALDGLFEGLGDMWSKASSWGKDLLGNVKDVLGIHSPSKEFAELGLFCVEGLREAFMQTDCLVMCLTELLEKLKSKMKEFVELVREKVLEYAKLFMEFLQKQLADITALLMQTTQNILKLMQELSQNILMIVQQLVQSVLQMVNQAVGEILSLCQQIASSFATMASSSASAISGITSALNSIPRSITTVHTVITENVSTGRSTVSGSSASKGLKSPNVMVRYASGGFPSEGQIFMAREAGPELVGRIGNRTAVANNDQIVSGIAAGVYQAVAQAMAENSRASGDQAVYVYLDGAQIYSSVKKTESERGLPLMGNQLGYTY